MKKGQANKEEEEINEDEEEEDSQSDDIEFQRKRFNYPNLIFDNSFYEKTMINKSQFGHKKYIYYTENSRKTESVRNIVRDLPQFNPKLTDGLQPKKMKKRRKYFKNIFYFLIGAIAFISAAIQSYHTPHQNLKKIESGVDTISENVRNLQKLLSTSQYTEYLLIPQLIQIGELLNDSSLVNIVASEIHNQNIAPLLYRTIGSEAGGCESLISQKIIEYSLFFLHDLTAFTNGFIISKDAVTKVFSNCNDIVDIDNALFSLLVAYVHKGKNLTLLNGIAKPIVKTILRDGNFGPWNLGPMKFFAYWTTISNLIPEDKENICRFVDFSSKNQDGWKSEFNAMICLLSKNIQCPSFENIDLYNLYKRDECREIFTQFNKTSSQNFGQL
ncbi:hypothetical protein M9Y10_044463 [Tritrichomonas musculus]|uniref:Transmembrane protein n=1 Tax=Tritrichomonas musculus TaxID=1915356 RepID=A0ABR2JSH4_9EUKA